MEKIDAHQHFWRYSPATHAWISDAMQVLRRDYLPPDLKPALETNGFAGCVAVQASQTEAETDFLLQLADQYDFIRGVVGWVDLRDPQLGERLAHWTQHSKLKGVRHVVQDEPDDRFLLRPDFLRGVAMLADFHLTYDILIFERQLPAAVAFVEKFPELPLVVDHIAKPRIADGMLEPWAQHMRQLAQFPHVHCKVSGMVTEADWQGWTPDHFKPYLDVVFEAFGPERLMFGSDWPVCRLAGEYDQVVQLLDDYLSGYSKEEQARVWGQNATQFYKL
ncbi:L-fuconolactonase [Catalinimonas alkaloidigena]|uniref:L-fuconolactonase n=1 Tax=Catalinimonas alkaloidigena TaxID=1075417 RepID=A0A1G9J8L8_9BACT|nr:amidohydrolase family protein [Catalinimonas alkaloidigena]SDL33545.1 L-fuconolactonase [Catalinimonas alkaloidigena]